MHVCMCTCVVSTASSRLIYCVYTSLHHSLHHSLTHSLDVVSQEMFANLSTYGIDLQQPSEQDLANLDWLREVRE
jgi:hypothetical protein